MDSHIYASAPDFPWQLDDLLPDTFASRKGVSKLGGLPATILVTGGRHHRYVMSLQYLHLIS